MNSSLAESITYSSIELTPEADESNGNSIITIAKKLQQGDFVEYIFVEGMNEPLSGQVISIPTSSNFAFIRDGARIHFINLRTVKEVKHLSRGDSSKFNFELHPLSHNDIQKRLKKAELEKERLWIGDVVPKEARQTFHHLRNIYRHDVVTWDKDCGILVFESVCVKPPYDGSNLELVEQNQELIKGVQVQGVLEHLQKIFASKSTLQQSTLSSTPVPANTDQIPLQSPYSDANCTFSSPLSLSFNNMTLTDESTSNNGPADLSSSVDDIFHSPQSTLSTHPLDAS